jgi:ribose transport system substrate-binding protein
MSSQQKWLLIVAAIALLGAGWFRLQADSIPATPRVSVAIVTGGSGPYWQLVASGAHAAAERYNVDVSVELPEADENLAQQTALLENLKGKQLAGIAVSPLDATGQNSLIDELAKSTHLVTFDSDAPSSQRLSYIGTINVMAGRLAAELAQAAIPNGGQVAVVLANLTKNNMVERREGLEAKLAKIAADGGDYEVVEWIVDEGSTDRCRELVTAVLDEHPDLACLIGMNAQHGAILLDVLKAQKKLGKVAVIAFDEEEETLKGIEEGTIFGTVVQDPYRYGFDSVGVLASYARDENLRPHKGSFSTYGVAPFSVKQDSVADFRRELKARLAVAGKK